MESFVKAMAGGKFRRAVACLWRVVLVATFLGGMVAGDPAGDRAVLLEFKAGITNSDVLGWTDPNPCLWNAKMVKCDAAGNVVQLRVRELGLTGTVTPKLNSLSSLEYLELNLNFFTGAMPSLAGLSRLQYAYLDDNSFTSIPPDIFDGLTSIIELHVENNVDLNSPDGWSIPESIASLSTLSVLAVTNASVTGPLPSFLGTMPALKTLEAAYNRLEGGIPDSFQKSSITTLKLNNQGMNGSIAAIGGMTGARILWVHVNKMTGPVPAGLEGAAGLTSLRINDNQLVGRLPPGLASIPSLSECLMKNNHLSGESPAFQPGVLTNSDADTFCGAAGVPCSAKVNYLLDFLEAAGYPQQVAVSWVGPDPCTGPWIGVACDPTSGEIVSITLPNYKLTGTISPSLGNLTYLRSLNLATNALTGTVPSELTKIPSLTSVDVSDNNLSAPLPLFPSSVTFKYAGNPLIVGAMQPPVAGTPPAPQTPTAPTPGANPTPAGVIPPSGNGTTAGPISHKSKSVVLVVVVVAAGIVTAVAAAIIIFFLVKRKKKKLQAVNGMSVYPRVDSGSDRDLKVMESNNSSASHQATVSSYGTLSGAGDSLQSSSPSVDHQALEQGNMFMSIEVLRAVTNNFSEDNILGRGGFGVVYRGELQDGTQIAVKRMQAGVVSNKGLCEFQSEITVLTKVKHRHLVGLLGYCANGNERLLVYEYMPQGTLAQHLFEYRQLQEKPLSWMMRLSIGLDVARGLEYLHNLAHRSFIHRDLKPSNILLTEDFRAKVSDFGLVKLAPEGNYSVETRLAGTFGYLAPEYAVTGRVTTKADVFSFGVVLMELITGRRALDETQAEENVHLVTWFQRMMHVNKDNLRSAVDPTIDAGDDDTYKTICTVAELAGYCTSREPSSRPDMSYAVSVLTPFVEQWKPTFHGHDGACNSSEDLELSLPQALKQWQEYEGDSTMSQRLDDTKGSIPVRPVGFADSFTSTDGR